MSSALQLTATATILNGNGLAPNVALSNAISSFGSLPTISYTANVFSAAASTLDSGDAYLGRCYPILEWEFLTMFFGCWIIILVMHRQFAQHHWAIYFKVMLFLALLILAILLG